MSSRPLLLVPGEPTIPSGLRLLVQTNAEPVEWRPVEQRWSLRHAPVHRRSERFEDAVHRRDLHVLGVLRFGFELVDLVRFFERRQRELPEVFLENGNAAPHSGDTAQPRRFDAPFNVRVQKRSDIAEIHSGLYRAASRPAWISPGLDLADEQPFPISRFFHRLNRTLLARFHSRDRELVRGNPIALPAMHHVEPQMFETPPSVLAVAFRASSSDRHRSSLHGWLLCGWSTTRGSARLA